MLIRLKFIVLMLVLGTLVFFVDFDNAVDAKVEEKNTSPQSKQSVNKETTKSEKKEGNSEKASDNANGKDNVQDSTNSKDSNKTQDTNAKNNSQPKQEPKVLPSVPVYLNTQQIDEIRQKVKETSLSTNFQDKEYYLWRTSHGEMKFLCFVKEAPETCANFHRLVQAGYYNGTYFHRVVARYIIQGGDILSRDLDPANDGQGGPGYTIPFEWNYLRHERGVVAMARGVDLDNSGSQFYIALDDLPDLDSRYTIFGKFVSGLEVLADIEKVPVTYAINHEMSRPLKPVFIAEILHLPKDGKVKENLSYNPDPKDK